MREREREREGRTDGQIDRKRIGKANYGLVTFTEQIVNVISPKTKHFMAIDGAHLT